MLDQLHDGDLPLDLLQHRLRQLVLVDDLDGHLLAEHAVRPQFDETLKKEKEKGLKFYSRNAPNIFYRAIHQVMTNLPLTSKQKFRFGLAWPSQAQAELLFRSQWEVRHSLICHPVNEHEIKVKPAWQRPPFQE